MSGAVYRGFGTILKSEDQDDGTIKVFGVASTGARDSAGEIVHPDAMKAALPDYSKFPALREQHDGTKAAGRVLEAYVDDAGATQIEAHVVDPVAIAKVRAGVYSAFSIGGKVTKRDTDDRSVIKGLRLLEISLVDVPCNPEATLNMWKADTMSDNNPSGDEVVAKAKEMAESAGRKSYKDYLYKAREELLAERGLPTQAEREAAAIEAADGPNADDAAKAAEVATPGVVETAAADDAAKGEAIDPAAALADALAKAASAAADTVITAPANPMADLKKSAAAMTILVTKAETDLAKGLYTVARLAQVIDAVADIQQSCAWEAENEGDNSPVPAAIAASVAALCTNLVHMVAEETAEIIAAYAAQGIDIDFDPSDDDDADDFAFAAAVVDLVKADTDLMEKAGKRNSKADVKVIQESHDNMVQLGAKCHGKNEEDGTASENAEAEASKAALIAENDRLAKALADAAPAVDEITKAFGDKLGIMSNTIETLTKRLERVESEPAAPKTAAGALRTVTKTMDVSPSTAEAHNASISGISPDDFAKAMESLPDKERGELMLRIALAQPQIVKPGR